MVFLDLYQFFAEKNTSLLPDYGVFVLLFSNLAHPFLSHFLLTGVIFCVQSPCLFSFEVSGCEVVWAIRDSSIGSTFFDEGAATFFLPHLSTPHHSSAAECGSRVEGQVTVRTRPMKRMKYMLDPLDEGETKTDSIAVPSSSTDQQLELATCPQQVGTGAEKMAGAESSLHSSSVGSALGPDWSSDLAFRGSSEHWVSQLSGCK